MHRGWVWSPELPRLGWAATLIATWLAVMSGAAVRLPANLASPVVFLGLIIAPGYLLGDLLSRRWRPDTLERLALAFPVGIAILAVPGMIGLYRRFTLLQLVSGWIVASGLAVAAWLLLTLIALLRPRRFGSSGVAWAPDEILLFALTAGMFALAVPALRLSKIDGDAYAVASFAVDALAGLPLNAHEPLFGTELGPGVRMVFNQSLPMEYLWSHFSGIGPIPLWSNFSRWVLAPWALFAAYTLGKAAFSLTPGPSPTRRGENTQSGPFSAAKRDGARRLGLTVAAVQMLIFLAAPFLRGDNVSLFFFERINADKFLVPAAMLPVLFALAIRVARAGYSPWENRPQPPDRGIRVRAGRDGGWAQMPAAAVVALAVSAIHPFIAAMAATAMAGFAVLHLLLGVRRRASWAQSAAVGMLILVVMLLPVVELVLSRGEDALVASFPSSVEGWPVGMRRVAVLPGVSLPTLDYHGPLPSLRQLDVQQVSASDDPFLMWRFAVNMERRRLILFDLDHYTADPNLLFEPPYVLALLILPFLLRGMRRDVGAQFAVGSALAALLAMFNPWLTPLIGSLVMPWILWRFVWAIPYALIIGLGLARLATPGVVPSSATPTERGWATADQGPVSAKRAWLLPLILLATTAALSPLIARNLRVQVERKEYPAFFPAPAGIMNALTALAIEPSIVLAPQDLSVTIPAHVANANVVAHRAPTTSEVFPADRQDEALQRLIDQEAFYSTPYLTERSLAILRRWSVDFIAAPTGTRLEAQLQLASQWFRWQADDASYSLYAVTATPEPTDAIRGNGLYVGRRWDEARAAYEQALEAAPDDLLALAGMADLSHTLGDFDAALTYLDRSLAVADLPVLHYRRGRLLLEMGSPEEASDALRRAAEDAPEVATFRAALGDACLVGGDLTCAANEYFAASETRQLAGEDARLIAEAELWRQRGRIDRALPRYAKAATLRPTPYNRLLLIGAYREADLPDMAGKMARALLAEHPLTTSVIAAVADVYAALGRPEEAAGLYRRALLLLQVKAQDETEVRLALARALLDSGRLVAASRHVETALARVPEHAEAHRLQGDILRERGDAEAALAAYQRAFALNPAQVGLYLALRNQLRAQGAAPDQAEDALDRAETYNPTEASLALDRGDDLQRSGDSRNALDAYRQALEALQESSEIGQAGVAPADGSRAFVFARLAELHEDLGQSREALSFYRAAVAAGHGAAWAQRALGDALRRQGDFDAAEAAYRAALSADPGNVDANERLADLLRARGDEAAAKAIRDALPELALARLESPLTGPALAASSGGASKTTVALQSDETLLARPLPAMAASGLDASAQLIAAESDASALRVLASARHTEGQNARALQLYRARIAHADGQGWDPVIVARYWSHLGSLALADGDLETAGEAYGRALALDGWRPDAYLGLASVAAARGQTGEALRLSRRAVQAAPGSVEARTALAASLEAFGGTEEARFLYETTAQAHPGNAQAILALARALQAAGLYADAADRFEQARRAAPGMAAPHLGLAELATRRGDDATARALLKQALAADRADPMPYLRLAELAVRSGDEATASEYYVESAARATDSSAPALAASLIHNARYREALAFLEERLADRPGDADLLRQAAQAQHALGRFTDAVDSLRRASVMAPSGGLADAALGDLYRAQGRLAEAEAAYRRAIDREPGVASHVAGLAATLTAKGERPLALVALAEGQMRVEPAQRSRLDALAHDLRMLSGDAASAESALARENVKRTMEAELLWAGHEAARGRYDEAVRRYETLASAHPDAGEPRLALAELYLRRRDAGDRAIAAAGEATRVAPSDPAAWLALARAQTEAGAESAAVETYQRVIRLAPTTPEGYLGLAALHDAAGRTADARAAYAAGAQAAPWSPALLGAYGLFLTTQGEGETALALLDDAVMTAPGAANFMARAAVLAELGRTEEAARDLEDAISREPGTLEPRLALGDLRAKAGDYEGAARAYDAALRCAPGHPAAYLRLSSLAQEREDEDAAASWRKKAATVALAGLAPSER